jgi:hypothetical protein
MKRLGWLVPAILFLAACSSAGSTASAPAAQGGGGATENFAVTTSKDAAAKPASGQVANGVPVPQAFDVTRSVILTANISMKSSDPWITADKAQAVALSLGGDVIGVSESGGKDNHLASLTLRVPSDRFTDALRQLRALDGEVVSSTVDGKDVTDQFVDLKARLSAKQSEEQRYTALLALASVRTQIEQLQGQVNSIASRTQFSTIVMSITPAVATVLTPPASAWDPSKTITSALKTLAVMLQGFADIAIWLVVFGWIPLLVLAVALIATRGRRTARVAA